LTFGRWQRILLALLLVNWWGGEEGSHHGLVEKTRGALAGG
jgi:hypothetical protein